MVEVSRSSNRITLKPWQEEGVRHCLQRNHAALFMEMRLGKTLTLIRAAEQWKPTVSRALVIAPNRVLRTWRQNLESEGFFPVNSASVSRDERLSRVLEVFQHCDQQQWVLTNPQSLLKTPELVELPWDLVTIDESVVIKNPKAQLTDLCTGKNKEYPGGFRKVPHRAILSGCPAPEDYSELFTQFVFLRNEFMGKKNFWSWRDTYYENDGIGYDWKPKPGTVATIRRQLRFDAFVKTKEDVGMDTKPVFETRHCEMTPRQRKLYKKLMTEWATETQETQSALTVALWAERLAGGFTPELECVSCTKSNLLIELLDNELKGQQVVIWFKFREELQHCMRELIEAKKLCTYVWGGMSEKDADLSLSNFESGRYPYLLATQKSVKYGADFSMGNTDIYYSRERSCDDRIQTEQRLENMNKITPTLHIDLCTEDTIDEDIIPELVEKKLDATALTYRIKENMTWQRSRWLKN